jgi:hypothetical protein
MVVNRKGREDEAKEDPEANVQAIAEAVKELIELRVVSGQDHDIDSDSDIHIELTFD